MAGGTPRSVVLTVVLAVLVAAGALGGAGVVRWRAAESTRTPPSSQNPPPSSAVGVSGCPTGHCTVLATSVIGGTSFELVADPDARSGRLRVGGTTSGTVIEATVTELGVTLTRESLQCIAGGPAACLIKGELDGGGIAGQIVVGRSDKWSRTEKTYLSVAGYLALANIDGSAAPEILAAQRAACTRADGACPVYMQVFTIVGEEMGCTKDFPRLDKLPGYAPAVKLTGALLSPCR